MLLNKPRKRTQYLRGACLSAARRLKLGARGAQRLIEGAYIVVNFGLLCILVAGLIGMSHPVFVALLPDITSWLDLH